MSLRKLRGLPFLLALVVFMAWFVLLRPAGLSGTASYVLVTGVSMEPTLADGDLAVVRTAGSYDRGDVIAFRVPEGQPGEGSLVIHRIVGGSAAGGFVMQGDNKQAPDSWRPSAEDIVGALWFTVPGAGRLLGRLRDPATFAAFSAALAVFMVLVGPEKAEKTASSRRHSSTPISAHSSSQDAQAELAELHERIFGETAPPRASPSLSNGVALSARTQPSAQPPGG